VAVPDEKKAVTASKTGLQLTGVVDSPPLEYFFDVPDVSIWRVYLDWVGQTRESALLQIQDTK
jgi:hypothetical protein